MTRRENYIALAVGAYHMGLLNAFTTYRDAGLLRHAHESILDYIQRQAANDWDTNAMRLEKFLEVQQ